MDMKRQVCRCCGALIDDIRVRSACSKSCATLLTRIWGRKKAQCCRCGGETASVLHPYCQDCQEYIRNQPGVNVLNAYVARNWVEGSPLRQGQSFQNVLFRKQHGHDAERICSRMETRPPICKKCGRYVECSDGIFDVKRWKRPCLREGDGTRCSKWVEKDA